MAETVMLTASDFVSKDAFDIHVKSMRDRADSDGKVSDARFDRLETKIEAIGENVDKSLELMNERMEKRLAQIDGKIGALNERLDKNLAQYEAIASEMRGDIKAINTRFDTQQTKFGWYLTVFGIVITGIIAAIQLWK